MYVAKIENHCLGNTSFVFCLFVFNLFHNDIEIELLKKNQYSTI